MSITCWASKMHRSQISPIETESRFPFVNRVTRMRTLKHASITSAIALGLAATGVGVASASTHATPARGLTSVTANAKGNHSSSTSMPPGVPGGIGGDVSAVTDSSITVTDRNGTSSTYGVDSSTTITKGAQSATLADIAVGDSVHIRVRSTDSTLASAIDIVPAGIGGKVTAINGDVLTIAGPNDTTGSIVVSEATIYMKGGTTATLSDISVGSFIFAQGSYGSSATVVDATTVGIGQPGPDGHGAAPPPGAAFAMPGGPGIGLPPDSKGTSN